MAKDNNIVEANIHPGRNLGFGRKVPKAKDRIGTLVRFFTYLSKQKFKLFIIFLLVTLGSILSLIGPFLIGFAIDKYIIPGNFKGLFFIILSMLLIYFFNCISTLVQNNIMINVAQNTIKEMRKDLFGKLQVLPLKYFDSKPHGELMSRLTNDIENVSTTLNTSITQIINSIITLIGALAMMLWYSPLLTFLSLIIIPVLALGTKLLINYSSKFFISQQRILGDLNGHIEETISGQKVLKVFSMESSRIEEFEKKNRLLRDVGIRAQIFSGFIPTLMNQLNNISFAIIAGAGGWMAIKGIITLGSIASFVNYSKQFSKPLNDVAQQFNMLQSAIAGAERVFEVTDEEPEVEDIKEAKVLQNVKGAVTFNDVTFGYKKEVPVLKDITFYVKPGQTVALVGPTGSGKTTIVNLLTRFYDIDNGTVFIDGEDIRAVNRDSLRSSLGIVLQDTCLFSESVRENIRYGRLNATDEEVEIAAKLANADHFIAHLPEGYATILSEDGENLSKGQRQLLSIARTILSNPAILILDEATSSVDTRTETHIQEAMINLMKGRTSFVIAHRLSTIKNADLILVIKDGQIIESDTHKKLLDKKGFYYNLYLSQFKKQVS